jgi:hypothetical protein
MEQQDYDALVAALAPAQRLVFEAIREHGPVTDEHVCELTGVAGRSVRPRRAELAKHGLVRRIRSDTADTTRRVGVWELVPPEEVESAREAAHAVGPRRRKVSDLPLEVRVRAFFALARDEAVQVAVTESKERGARRARARIRDVLRQDERARRERMAELREAEEQASSLVDFLKTRNTLKRQEEVVRATLVFLREEVERQRMFGESAIPERLWALVPGLLVEVIEACESAYEEIARHTGHPSRRQVDIELDDADVIDGELLELVGGEDVTRDS